MGIGNFTITNKNGAPLSAGFYPGQKIEGLVNLTVAGEHMKCKGIRLDIEGSGRVAWSETTGVGEKEKTEHYRQDETYVDHHRYLKGSAEEDDDNVTLPVGQLQVGRAGLCSNQFLITCVHASQWMLQRASRSLVHRGFEKDLLEVAT